MLAERLQLETAPEKLIEAYFSATADVRHRRPLPIV